MKTWVARQISAGESGWAVIDTNGPHGDHIICGNLQKEDACLIAAAPDMQALLSAMLTGIQVAISRSETPP